MKTSVSVFILSLLFFCACDNEKILSGDELSISLEDRYFKGFSICTFTKKDGTTTRPEPGLSYVDGAPDEMWFKDGKLYELVDIDWSDIRWRKWSAYQEEKELGKILFFKGRDYRINSDGELSSLSSHPFEYETLGGKCFLRSDNGRQIMVTVIFPDDITDDIRIFPKTEYDLQEKLSPDKYVGIAEYHFFDSDNDALKYVVDRMRDWEPSTPLPPYVPLN